MTKKFAKYNAEGRILFSGEVPESMIELQGDNVYVGEVDLNAHWIQNGELAVRPPNPATISGSTLSNLPAPCVIQVNQTVYNCVDATAQLDFTYPGLYKIRVRSFPFLDATFEVTV